MIIIGIDIGEARTGVAICDENQILASPLCMIEEKNKDKLAEKIIEISNLKNANKIVLGYPKNMNGTLGPSAKNAEYLQKKLKESERIREQLQQENERLKIKVSLLEDDGR